MNFLHYIFDAWPRKKPKKDDEVFVTITYEDGTTSREKLNLLKGYSFNQSIGTTLHQMDQLWLEYLDKRILETFLKENQNE